MTYSEKLKDPRWQKKRLQIMERDGWSCRCCKSSTATLEIHHIGYRGSEPWETPDSLLATACSACHRCAQKIADLILDIDGIDGISLEEMRSAGTHIKPSLRLKMSEGGERAWLAYYSLMRIHILDARQTPIEGL